MPILFYNSFTITRLFSDYGSSLLDVPGPIWFGSLWHSSHTPHGDVQTPCFMAVGTQGGLKGVTMQQAEALGQGVILGNTYHLALRPGADLVAKLGGLHQFSGWRGPMLTDSGGYQVFSLADQRKIDEGGVRFRSHIDGKALLLSPETSIHTQQLLGADIIMAFDECPPADAPHDYQQNSLRRTLRWLERCKHQWLNGDESLAGSSERQALFGIIQGGLHQDLRLFSAEHTMKANLPGIAIGGLSVGESAEERNRVLDWLAPVLPHDRPRYLMGVGTPLDVVEAVARGIDMFDCVLPTRMGRHAIAYTDDGPLRLLQSRHSDDPQAIDTETASDASRVSRAYLRHLFKAKESLAGSLVSQHNLAYYQRLMRRMQEAIRAR